MYPLWTKHDIGASLKLAEHLAKDKDKAARTLQNMTIFILGKMLEAISTGQEVSVLASQVQALQTASQLLSATNTSPRLILEQLFLKLGK